MLPTRHVAPVALVALVTLVASCAGAGERPPARCDSGGIGLTELNCTDGRMYRVRDDGYAEAVCGGLPLACAALPALPTPAPLRRLELTNCTLPPGAAACLVRALRSPPPDVLMTMGLPEPLREGAFDGLEGVPELLMMNADAQTTIPPLSPLSLLRLRVVGGTNMSLPPTPLPPSLQSLEVSNSGVRSLTPAAFHGLNDLHTLSVWGNKLEEVAEEMFELLPSLRTLTLSRNPLKRLRLSRARRLESLTARRVALDVLKEGDISGLLELKELIIEYTPPLTLSPRSLSSLPSLTSLTVTHSGVTSLPPTLLEGSNALLHVTLKENQIEEISEDVFKNQTRLERLDLSHNLISALSRETFRDLTALRDLSLDYNRITALPERAFSSLPRLSSLSLSYNLISVIPPTAFPPSPLRKLILSHNRLSYAPPSLPEGGDGDEYFDIGVQSPFSALVELEQLDLSYNNISYMFSDWLIVLIQRLHRLDLSHNAFLELNSGDLQFLQQDLTVDLRSNNITSVSPPPSYLPPTAATILLEDNPYACDCNLYPLLESLPSLPSYRLGGARCHSPPALLDTPLPALDVTLLTCPLPPPHTSCRVRPARARIECTAATAANITTLPDPREYGLPELSLTLTTGIDLDLLSGLPPYVTEVNVSRLHLPTLPPGLPDTVRLLDARYNHLTALPAHLLEGNHTLLLQGNPIACDCWHSDGVAALLRHRGKVEDMELVECGGGGRVDAVDAGALCDVHRAVAVGSILAALGVMLAVVLTLTWRHSRAIRRHLAALPGLRWLLDDGDTRDDEDKQYDIFVSFSHEDFPWVRDRLLPVLDAQYAVCVHYRQWEVGQAIPVQIARSVDSSRRTLVVLSPAFARSTWACEEFRAALAASARDGTPRALVVLLGRVDLSRLHADLRDYLALTTYLEADDPRFWEKLKRALPRTRTQRTNHRPEETNTHSKLSSLFTAIKNKFKQPSVIDLPDPVKVRSDPDKVVSDPVKVLSDPKSLDVILDKNGQLVNMAYVKDV